MTYLLSVLLGSMVPGSKVQLVLNPVSWPIFSEYSGTKVTLNAEPF